MQAGQALEGFDFDNSHKISWAWSRYQARLVCSCICHGECIWKFFLTTKRTYCRCSSCVNSSVPEFVSTVWYQKYKKKNCIGWSVVPNFSTVKYLIKWSRRMRLQKLLNSHSPRTRGGEGRWQLPCWVWGGHAACIFQQKNAQLEFRKAGL